MSAALRLGHGVGWSWRRAMERVCSARLAADRAVKLASSLCWRRAVGERADCEVQFVAAWIEFMRGVRA